ncbi:hypothetical protein QM480_23745 [Flectobacillus sp. DC10W]|jgi:hypothetical protein|uniref:DUF11 domain-containing protein n=1 Tax=Flectobacillus longus TaxID=2984207 RepID=A0ABT6YUU4_9BACT|nr:hypothetical protein [Flectobacillus longus]MDI9867377.1 hypothetical protein [Flectobacillus longus]
MRKLLLSFSFLLGLVLSNGSAHGQGSTPHFSYKIELRSDGYYYATMKSDVAYSASSNQTTISTIQYTLVAPIGTFAPISATSNTMTNLVGGVEDLLPSTNTGNYIWSTQRTALNANEYGYFALTGSPILNNIVAGVEIPLFRFRTQACIGSIRMYRNVADGTGGADTPKLNSANSIYLSGVSGALSDSYKDNYGTATVCPTPPLPDLTTSISGPSTGSPNTAYAYTVTINNVGSGPSTGSVSESFSIPTGLTFNSGGGSGWVCAPSGPVAGPTTIVCTNSAPNIPASGSVNFPLNVTPTTTGGISVSGIVSGGGETNTSNNNATSNTTTVGCGISAGVLSKL